MPDPTPEDLRGILHADGSPERFSVDRYRPSAAAGVVVDRYWSVRWNLPDNAAHRQEILPHPCVQLVVEAGRSGVFGIGTGKSMKVLAGRGNAFGIKFRPAMFTAVYRHAPAALNGHRIELGEALGEPGLRYERAVLAAGDDAERVAAAEHLIETLEPTIDERAALTCRIVEHIADHRDTVSVVAVARTFGLTTRGLQRLFHRYAGVSPKWVIQRYRMHEVVTRLEAGEPVDLAAVAAQLGFYDQAHLTRAFTDLVGRPPARYAADRRQPPAPPKLGQSEKKPKAQ